jgi:hypothetical protein
MKDEKMTTIRPLAVSHPLRFGTGSKPPGMDARTTSPAEPGRAVVPGSKKALFFSAILSLLSSYAFAGNKPLLEWPEEGPTATSPQKQQAAAPSQKQPAAATLPQKQQAAAPPQKQPAAETSPQKQRAAAPSQQAQPTKPAQETSGQGENSELIPLDFGQAATSLGEMAEWIQSQAEEVELESFLKQLDEEMTKKMTQEGLSFQTVNKWAIQQIQKKRQERGKTGDAFDQQLDQQVKELEEVDQVLTFFQQFDEELVNRTNSLGSFSKAANYWGFQKLQKKKQALGKTGDYIDQLFDQRIQSLQEGIDTEEFIARVAKEMAQQSKIPPIQQLEWGIKRLQEYQKVRNLRGDISDALLESNIQAMQQKIEELSNDIIYGGFGVPPASSR